MTSVVLPHDYSFQRIQQHNNTTMHRGLLRCSSVRLAAWGANPADIKFTSISKREGAAFLASARKKHEFKKLDEQAQRMTVSVGSSEYLKNMQQEGETETTNPKTGEVCLPIYPTHLPTNLGSFCFD